MLKLLAPALSTVSECPGAPFRSGSGDKECQHGSRGRGRFSGLMWAHREPSPSARWSLGRVWGRWASWGRGRRSGGWGRWRG